LINREESAVGNLQLAVGKGSIISKRWTKFAPGRLIKRQVSNIQPPVSSIYHPVSSNKFLVSNQHPTR